MSSGRTGNAKCVESEEECGGGKWKKKEEGGKDDIWGAKGEKDRESVYEIERERRRRIPFGGKYKFQVI